MYYENKYFYGDKEVILELTKELKRRLPRAQKMAKKYEKEACVVCSKDSFNTYEIATVAGCSFHDEKDIVIVINCCGEIDSIIPYHVDGYGG